MTRSIEDLRLPLLAQVPTLCARALAEADDKGSEVHPQPEVDHEILERLAVSAERYRHLKSRHVRCGREPASAGDFITGIQKLRVHNGTGSIFRVKARAKRNNSKAIVRTRLQHAGGNQNTLVYIVCVLLVRRSFDCASG